MSSGNKAIVEKVNAAFARNSVEDFLALCAEDVAFTMVGTKTVTGKEPIRAWMGSMDMDPPVISVADTIAEGERVTSHGTMTMKNKEGIVEHFAYCDIYRLSGGKVAELTAFMMKAEPR